MAQRQVWESSHPPVPKHVTRSKHPSGRACTGHVEQRVRRHTV